MADAKARTAQSPPRADIQPAEVSAQGETWLDDYAWIRAENWREVLRDPSALPPEIRALLEAENAYAEEILGPTQPLQKQLVREMRARLREDDSEPPAPDGPFSYYSRFRHGGQHRIYCRRPRAGGKETVLLDGDARAAGNAFFHLGGARHSPDHRKFAWSADDKGSEMYAIGVRDVAAEIDLDDRVENAGAEIVWTRDSSAFLYILQDESHRPFRVMLHRLGSVADADVCIYEEADPAWFLALSPYAMGAPRLHPGPWPRFLRRRTSSIWRPRSSPPRLIAPRRPGLRYQPMDHGDVFYIKTNSGARDFEIVVAPAEAPEEANWRAFLPAKDGRLIETAALFKDYLVLLAREENVPRLIVHELASGRSHEIGFEAQTYFLKLETVYEFDSPVFRFSYSSMACSQETYDYDMAARQRLLLKKQMTPKDFDAAAYVVRSVLAPTPDGETIADLAALSARYADRRDGAAADLRIWRLWTRDGRELLDQSTVAGRSRLRLRHRARARRHGEGLALVRGRQARQESQYFRRFSRRDAPSGRARLCRRAPYHRAWGQRGRNVDGGDRQRGAGTVRRHHRRRAVRRCPEYDARRAAFRSRRPNGWNGAIRSATRRPSRRSEPIRPTTTFGRNAIRPFWRWQASPIRASPIGSRPNGSRGCAPR